MTRGFRLRPSVSDIEDGMSPIAIKKMLVMIRKYKLNPLWLLTGQGEMFNRS